jgi:prepilin-type N-terminal cleavage/methylation domain-containing protein
MNQIKYHKQSGFTLIELMLAMSFISLLLIAITATTIQVSNVYNKGLTLRSVNQVGRELTASLRRDINASQSFNVSNPKDTKDGTRRYLVQKANDNKTFGGRLCMGSVSYVWNYGETLTNDKASDYNKYNDNTKVRLARVIDNGAQLCFSPSSPVEKNMATELLISKDNLELALHNFNITQSDSTTITSQALYTITLTIGTNEQDTITGLGNGSEECTPSSGGSENWEFCAINKFDIVARAANSIGTGEN